MEGQKNVILPICLKFLKMELLRTGDLHTFVAGSNCRNFCTFERTYRTKDCQHWQGTKVDFKGRVPAPSVPDSTMEIVPVILV